MDSIHFKAANMEIHLGLMEECTVQTDTIKWDKILSENKLVQNVQIFSTSTELIIPDDFITLMEVKMSNFIQ
jgi:hypothetical protein